VSESSRYPEHLLPIAGQLPETYTRFADLREEYLLGYGYHTARAYWGDLQELYLWAAERGKDVLNLTQREFTQWVALHRRRGYSENTIRRRLTAARGLYTLLASDGLQVSSPRYRPPRTSNTKP
jgi:site-specific recombinase XerD